MIMKYYLLSASGESKVHSHDYFEVSICKSGKGRCYCEGRYTDVFPGTIRITPPLISHKSDSEGEFERICIFGDFKHFFNFSNSVMITDNSKNEGLTLAQLIYENYHSNPEYSNALCDALAHFILQMLDTDNQIHIKVREIMNTLSARFSDTEIDIQKILTDSGYAEDYIRSQFKKISGSTPTEFLTKIRMRNACHLIDTYKTAMSLSEIAEKCGYTDYVYFSRRFKQIMGMSPKRYKDMQNT